MVSVTNIKLLGVALITIFGAGLARAGTVHHHSSTTVHTGGHGNYHGGYHNGHGYYAHNGQGYYTHGGTGTTLTRVTAPVIGTAVITMAVITMEGITPITHLFPWASNTDSLSGTRLLTPLRRLGASIHWWLGC